MKTRTKYESYQAAMRLLENAKRHKDMPMCIAAVAVAESIIADRLQSYLYFKAPEILIEKGKEKKFVATSKMVSECLKYFPELKVHVNSKNHGKVKSTNLFLEINMWLDSRNDICHGFVKSKPGTPTKEISAFHKAAIKAAEDGISLTKLVSKWHKQQLRITNKKK